MITTRAVMEILSVRAVRASRFSRAPLECSRHRSPVAAGLAAVWRSLRGWLPTLRERSLVLGDAQLEFRSSLALAFDRVSATLDAVRGHAHVDVLPTGFHLPVIHTALVDGLPGHCSV